jgi:hypothetical protein
MGEQRVALALDEGAVLHGHPLVLCATDLIHGVGQMAQDVELVEQNLGLRRLRLHRVAERLPHVHHGQPNPGRLLGAQVEKEPVQVGFGPSLPPDPDRAPPFQIAHHNAIGVALFDRQLIHPDDLWRGLRRLGQPRPHILGVQILDRVRMQVQQLGDGLVRHVPAQKADVVGEPLRIPRILRQPIQPLHLHPLTTRAGHPPLLKRQVDPPARRIGIPHPACGAVVEGAVPCPTAGAHSSFFRRMRMTSRAWGSPKIPCSRLRARNPGKENKAARVWIRFMVPPGHRSPGVCHRSRTRFEGSPRWPNPRLGAELGRFTRTHVSIPICLEPIIFTPPLWTSVVKAIEAYTKTTEKDVYTREERIEALNKAVHRWKEDFDRRLENGSKPSRTEEARLEVISDIFSAIDRERKEHQSSREQQRQSNTVSKKGGKGQLVKCYRGMFYTHPQFADAKKGIVRPMSSSDRGADFDTENTNYTAWDNQPTQPAAIATGHPRLWAIDHRDNGKLKYDPNEPVGVVLEFECSATEYTRMNEGEYQIQGEIQADRVHKLYPGMNLVKFQENLSVVEETEVTSTSEPCTYKDEATQALNQMKDWTPTQLDRERKWLMIKMRTSSIYDPKQKKSMILKLEKEYGIKY